MSFRDLDTERYGHVSHSRHQNRPPQKVMTIGEKAQATYHPRHHCDLKEGLFDAIGKTVEVEYIGLADSDDLYAGERLYKETQINGALQNTWVPEEDLDFID